MSSFLTNHSRPEIPAEVLIHGYINLCTEICELQKALRLKWILNSETSAQTTEEELIERATREKFKRV